MKTPYCLSTALFWLERGEIPIPIVPGTKKPPRGFMWKRLYSRPPNEAEVRSWWKRWPNAQVAILLGQRLVSLDPDGPGAEATLSTLNLPRTPTIRTCRGRNRLFCVKQPMQGRSITAADGSKLELRGLGQYQLVPDSIHPSGIAYEWDVPTTAPFALLPAEVLRLFQPKPDAADRNRAAKPERSLSTRIQKALARNPRLRAAFEGTIPPPNDNSGSGYDMVLAHECRRAGLSETDAELLLSAAPYPKRNPRTPKYVRRTVSQAFAAGGEAKGNGGGYGSIPAWVVGSRIWRRLSPKAKALYGVLRVRALRPSGLVKDGRPKLADLAGISTESVGAALTELKKAGLVSRVKRWRLGTNIWVTDPTCTEKRGLQVNDRKAVAAADAPLASHLHQEKDAVGDNARRPRGPKAASPPQEPAHLCGEEIGIGGEGQRPRPKRPSPAFTPNNKFDLYPDNTAVGDSRETSVSDGSVEVPEERPSPIHVTNEHLHRTLPGIGGSDLHRTFPGTTDREDINPWDE